MERHDREKEHADFVKKLKYVNNFIFLSRIYFIYMILTKEKARYHYNKLIYDKKYDVCSYIIN